MWAQPNNNTAEAARTTAVKHTQYLGRSKSFVRDDGFQWMASFYGHRTCLTTNSNEFYSMRFSCMGKIYFFKGLDYDLEYECIMGGLGIFDLGFCYSVSE